MILTSHQPVYLPWLGLFHKIALADTYCFFDVAQFLLKDWNNRNRIKTTNGPSWLTVPVHKKGYVEKQINAIEIDNEYDWRKKHWSTLLGYYKKTPHFARYADFFEDTYRREWYMLVDLNEHMLRYFLSVLGISVRFVKASAYDFAGRKSDQVLDMCKKLGASCFIFGEQGRNYAVVEDFTRSGIRVHFQSYRHPVYRQRWGEFVPYLSIVDLLFNEGAERARAIIMEGNITRDELRETCEGEAPFPLAGGACDAR